MDEIKSILKKIGEDPEREGLKDTPKRVWKMYQEVFKGYDKKQKPELTTFFNKVGINRYDEMIIDKGKFYSTCEHHLIPFFGEYWLAYIPEDKLIGLSKIGRLIQWHSARLQIQEQLTNQIVNDLVQMIQPHGIALVMRGRHLCKEMRGLKVNGEMTTTCMRGAFKDNINTRQEFLSLIK